MIFCHRCWNTSLLDKQWGVWVRFKHTISQKFTGYSGDIVTILAFLFSLWLLILSDTIRVPKHLTHKINGRSKISTGVHSLWQCSLLIGKKNFLSQGFSLHFEEWRGKCWTVFVIFVSCELHLQKKGSERYQQHLLKTAQWGGHPCAHPAPLPEATGAGDKDKADPRLRPSRGGITACSRGGWPLHHKVPGSP